MTKTVEIVKFRHTVTMNLDVIHTIERTKEYNEHGRLVSMSDRTIDRDYVAR